MESRYGFWSKGLRLAAFWLLLLSFSTRAVAGSADDLSARLDKVVDDAINENKIVGTVVIVARDGQVIYQRAAGYADREAGTPVESNTIFRFASLTKPLVSVAIMRLVEWGFIRLDDPVSRFLPYFTPRLKNGDPATITIRQLLTHTAGLNYGFLELITGPYHLLKISDGLDDVHITLEENMRRLAEAPLLYTPGEDWGYSLATDVLGAVIERVMHVPLDSAIFELVTGPLFMIDTEFYATQPWRLATPYADGLLKPVRMTEPYELNYGIGKIVYSPGRATDPTAYGSGGGGAVGTARDYIRFLEGLRTGHMPILRKSTLDLMKQNATGDLNINLKGKGWGFGLGFAVLLDPEAADSPMHAGSIEWSGVYGNTWWVDPEAGLSVVVLTNTAIEGMTGKFPNNIKTEVYK